MDKLTEEIIVDIVREFMELSQENIWIRDQNRKIPNDKGMYVVVGMVDAKPYSAQSNLETHFTEGSDPIPFEVEVSRIQTRENIQIDIMSRSADAISRRWELLLALNSIYSKQQQEQFGFKISRLPANFVNTSGRVEFFTGSQASGLAVRTSFCSTSPVRYWITSLVTSQ
jgi:hypothetical protein